MNPPNKRGKKDWPKPFKVSPKDFKEIMEADIYEIGVDLDSRSPIPKRRSKK